MDINYSTSRPDRLIGPAPTRDERIKYLVGRKFPILRLAKHGNFSQQIDVSAIKAFQEELVAKTDAELSDLCQDEYRKEAEAADKAHFFNKPDAVANVDHWAKQRYWSTDQGIALILGRDPRRVSWENIRSMVQVHWFAAKYAELRDLASGHSLAGGKLAGGFVTPPVFLRWAERYDLPIPEDLQAAVEKYAGNLRDWQDVANEWKGMYDTLDEAHKKYVEVAEQAATQARENMKTAVEHAARTAAGMVKKELDAKVAQLARITAERDALQERVLELEARPDQKGDSDDAKAVNLTVPSPQSRHRAQEKAILEWMALNQYDPQNIPKPGPGRAGAKADAKRSLVQARADIFQSAGTFDKAWQRLRDTDEIKDEE